MPLLTIQSSILSKEFATTFAPNTTIIIEYEPSSWTSFPAEPDCGIFSDYRDVEDVEILSIVQQIMVGADVDSEEEIATPTDVGMLDDIKRMCIEHFQEDHDDSDWSSNADEDHSEWKADIRRDESDYDDR